MKPKALNALRGSRNSECEYEKCEVLQKPSSRRSRGQNASSGINTEIGAGVTARRQELKGHRSKW